MKAELEAFGDGSGYSERRFTKRETDNDTLGKIRRVYGKQRRTAERELERPEAELVAKYAVRLEGFETNQTRLKNFDVALAARNLRGKLQEANGAGAQYETKLYFVSKGETEIRLDGKEVEFRDKSNDHEYTVGETPALNFAPGSVLAFRLRSNAHYRGILLGLESADGRVSVPLPREAFILATERMFFSEPDAEEVGELAGIPETGIIDRNMAPMWDGAGTSDTTRTGSEWIRPSLKDNWNYFVVVIEDEMILRSE